MPPRKKESEDEREAKFVLWKEGSEYKGLIKFQETRAKNPEASKVAVETADIYGDWTEVLKELFELMNVFKVPKKSKGKSI